MKDRTQAVTRRSRLQRIQNWLELAELANWSVTELAKCCGVSKRALQRYFQDNLGESPKEWLSEERQKRAIELLRIFSVKETAASLGYKHATHFSREFKKHWGYSPVEKPLSINSAKECRVWV